MSSELMELINQHIDYVQYVREKSENTVKNRRWALNNFVKLVNATRPSDITNDSINTWIIRQRQTSSSNLCGKTINTRLSHLKSFISWLEQRGYDLDVKRHLIERVIETKHISVYFTREQVQKILEAADARERLMINILFDTLMRRAELANLHVDNLKGREIRYIAKGKKRCVSYMSDSTVKLLHEWIEFYHIEGYIFPSNNGHLDPATIGRIIKGVCARAGFSEGHTHAFRHTGATDLELNGAPLELISTLLNHEKLDTTRIYTHASDLNLIHRIDRFAHSLA